MTGQKIKNIGWSLGNYCNARCKHCYSWKTRRGPASLCKQDIDTIINEIAAANVETVNLGGNEPIYTNGPSYEESLLPYIVEQLHARNIKVGITTNGISAVLLERMRPDVFSLINDWDISLDSPVRDEHNNNRRADIYDTALAALDVCTKHNVPKAIIVCGMRWNLDQEHLEGFLDLARRNDAELRINTLKPTEAHHMDQLPSRAQYYAAFDYLLTATDPVVIGESTLHGMTDKAYNGCPCGVYSLRIHSKTPEGTVPVSPCVYLHDLKVGDLLTQSLDAIIESEQFEKMRCRQRDLPPPCGECDLAATCRGGCAARAYLVRGSLDERDPYCPIEAKEEGVILHQHPDITVSHKGIRVHENYLCTWIGKPKPAAGTNEADNG